MDGNQGGQVRLGLPNDQYGRTLNTQEAKAAGYRAEPPPLYGGNLTPAHDWSAFDAAFHSRPAAVAPAPVIQRPPPIQTAGTPVRGGTPLVTPIDPRYQAPGGPAIGLTKYPTDVTAFDRARTQPPVSTGAPVAQTPETEPITVQRAAPQVVAPAPSVPPVAPVPTPSTVPAPTPAPVAAQPAPAPTPAPPIPAPPPVAAPTPPAIPLPPPAVQAQSENDPYRSKLRRGIDDEEEQYA